MALLTDIKTETQIMLTGVPRTITPLLFSQFLVVAHGMMLFLNFLKKIVKQLFKSC